jgi:integrase/recombinase XerD
MTSRAVDDYLRHLAVERGLARNTLASYRRDLAIYAEWLASAGFDGPEQVAERDLSAFLRYLGAEREPRLATSSIARVLSAVRGLHRFLADEGRTPTDASRELRPPKIPTRLPKPIPIEDVVAIIEATGVGDDVMALRDRALLELLYATGARISEAVGLDVDDLDLEPEAADAASGAEPGSVLLRGKGGKQRVVPIGSYARAAVQAYLVRSRPVLSAAGQATPALFLNARGGRLSRQSAWTVLVRAAERAGVAAEVSPHTLRHSFATHLLDGGADVRVVQELLGHASVTTTQVYTLVTVDSLREVYASSHPRALG